MKFQKFTALLLAVLLVLSLAACGTKDNEKKADMSSNDSAMTDEQKNAEEALALHKKLMEQENTILSQNTALWEKVFMAAEYVLADIVLFLSEITTFCFPTAPKFLNFII